jgi:hypothetical protein
MIPNKTPSKKDSAQTNSFVRPAAGAPSSLISDVLAPGASK